MAAIDRILPRLCSKLEKLEEKGHCVRSLRLEAHRCDQAAEVVGLARPSFDRYRIRPLLEMKIDGIDAGFGIDMLRLQAVQSESVHARTMTGHAEAGRAVQARIAGSGAVDDLIGKLGARVGLEVITR